MNDTLLWGLLWMSAYLVGGVPFGLLIGKLKGIDIRQHGSGNIGATNALRVLGKGPGILCFVLDVCKGALPVLISALIMDVRSGAGLSTADGAAWLGVGVACVLGHLFPPFIGFKGGKGVATAFGVFVSFFGITTFATLGALAVWIALVRATRYVSIASIGAAIALPVGTGITLTLQRSWEAAWPFGLVTMIIGAFVVVKHKSNLQRLRAGTEAKIGSGKAKPIANH